LPETKPFSTITRALICSGRPASQHEEVQHVQTAQEFNMPEIKIVPQDFDCACALRTIAFKVRKAPPFAP
jgi:hypothetical protein